MVRKKPIASLLQKEKKTVLNAWWIYFILHAILGDHYEGLKVLLGCGSFS